jgi:uncharacterized heparinase superfamily protein
MEVDRWRLPIVERQLDQKRLPKILGFESVDDAWSELSHRHFPFVTETEEANKFISEEDSKEIFRRAEFAMKRQVNLLGSGVMSLNAPIDWHTDPTVGRSWPPAFCRRIEYSNRGQPSDVKIPWEISRLQWLIPVGQAYVLTQNEEYAEFARQILGEWIEANPTGYSVNWSCTMEPALRIFTWVWLFHIFATSYAWSKPEFRLQFLRALYMHGVFVERHIERARINGNHYTADAAGMTWAGVFFDGAKSAARWSEVGWEILEAEIEIQVHLDGVDFEASSAYHRLVAELFWIAAHYRRSASKVPSQKYWDKLCAMADVTRHLCRPDGSVPNWGDADDARTLPFGFQNINDHRYLVDIINLSAGQQTGVSALNGGEHESFWVFGLVDKIEQTTVSSKAFPHGGVFILSDKRAHVMIDCGPIGLGGLGGHGHNDALAFELWCDNHPLIVDPGSYVYTADFEARNRFRFTSSHNTPQIDDLEINRPYSDDNLWNLHDDAKPELIAFNASESSSSFTGRHFGYLRLSSPVIIERKIVLDSCNGSLAIEDKFFVTGNPEGRTVKLPFHFAPHVKAMTDLAADVILLKSGPQRYRIWIEGAATGEALIIPTEISPSYGVKVPSSKLVYFAPLVNGLVLKTHIESVD